MTIYTSNSDATQGYFSKNEQIILPFTPLTVRGKNNHNNSEVPNRLKDLATILPWVRSQKFAYRVKRNESRVNRPRRKQDPQLPRFERWCVLRGIK